ncbi:CubicO group peptidase, beta-lactamase class C family [Chitinophaga sp. CF118]|uniref:serine hydrolase domain-containing protein n=1 Tax=Chitinophaga sp. CF118 TaxID=1884367 RepID=UPI0008E87F2A|nr:serine hydrolase domain-containing protein [Chitinophaga sp. CF118]SFD07443.1 CubicO group peptidase, beta-lactamase class C family [Chitinophaga sp. CF118]
MANIAKIQTLLNDTAKAIRAKYGLPNIAGVIVRDNGNTIMNTIQGVKNSSLSATAASNQMTTSDYFNVGSLSKPITGFLLACLIKKGILSWDTTIEDVFPEFKSKVFRDRSGMNDTFLKVKVYELMAHVSGMNGTQYHPDYDPVKKPDAHSRETDPFRFIQDQGLTAGGNSRDPEWMTNESLFYQRYLFTVLSMKKKKYQYHSTLNMGYQNQHVSGYGATVTICAAMAERKTGKVWEQLMDELLAGPLQGQFNIKYGNLSNGAQFHYYNGQKYVPNPNLDTPLMRYSSKFPTGDIHCTVGGMAQYIRYNLPALNYTQLFDVQQYHEPVTDAAKGGLVLSGGPVEKQHFWHTGSTGSSLAVVRIYAAAGRGVAVMMNCGGGPKDADANTAQSELLEKLEEINKNWDTI